MKNLLTAEQAGTILLVIFSLVIVFHIVALIGFVPTNMVWGGRLETREELVVFELLSLVIVMLAILVVCIRLGYIQWPRLMPVAKVAMWVIFVLFVLNTIGNALAVTDLERYGAGVVTLLLSFLSWRVAVEK